MAQHDYVIANATGADFRTDVNALAQAIVTLNNGATEPGTMFPYMLWVDTTTGTLKMRDAANLAWIEVADLGRRWAMGAVYNIKDYGAACDGATDDTAAVQDCVDTAPDGSIIWHPGGACMLGSPGIRAENRHNLRFTGPGWGAIFKRHSSYGPANAPLAVFGNAAPCTGIQFDSLAFDYNAGTTFGGITFYQAKRTRILDCRFFDSDVQALGASDRYAFVFGLQATEHEDTWFMGNLIEDLQCDFGPHKTAHILHNTIYRGGNTLGALNFTTSASGSDFWDLDIADNTIIDPQKYGITVTQESAAFNNNTYRRIRILNNTIARLNRNGNHGIVFGIPATGSTGNVYETITIDGNQIYSDSGLTLQAGIVFGVNGLVYTASDVRLTGNTITNAAYGIQFYGLRDFAITDNMATGITTVGLYTLNNTGYEHANGIITGNHLNMEAGSTAIRFQGSVGGVRVFDNKISGSPTTRFAIGTNDATDYIEDEILIGSGTVDLGTPGAVPGTVTGTVALTGATVGQPVEVFPPSGFSTSGNYVLTGRVTSAGTVTVYCTQIAGAAADPDGGGGTYRVRVRRIVNP